MNEGWKCPECGKCWAPFVMSCDCSGVPAQPIKVQPPTLGEKECRSCTDPVIEGTDYCPIHTWLRIWTEGVMA